MGTVEIIIIAVLVGLVFFSLCAIWFASIKKKKAETKKDDSNAKVEPVYKKQDEQGKKVEESKQEEPKKKEGFKIIRKKSEVKINKKALKTGSRNPTVTKVFVGGKNVEEEQKAEAIRIAEQNLKAEQLREAQRLAGFEDMPFGARENSIETTTTNGEFSIKAPIGMPNRAPIIGDRTNFASHLNVSDDGNVSGVSGIGIAKVIEETQRQANRVDDSTEQMVRNVRRNMLGDNSFEPDDIFEMLRNRRMGGYEPEVQSNKKQTLKDRAKKLDAETLIIADAISKPKSTTKK